MYNSQLTCTIPNAAKMTGLSRSTLYNLIASGQLNRIKIGKRALLKISEIEALLENCREV